MITSCTMASPDHLPIVLVHGDAQTGKKSLLEGLVSNVGRGNDASTSTMKFDTKYYTAAAEVHLTGGSHEGHSPDGVVEAVLLVFDSSRETTFESLKSWAAANETADGAEIKLCIANRVDALWEGGGMNRPDWMEAAQNWCTDNLFEYIEVAPKNPDIDACLELEGEKQGLQRVVLALEAHMWPGLTMKCNTEARPDVGGAQDRQPIDTLPHISDVSDSPARIPAPDSPVSSRDTRETADCMGNGHTHTDNVPRENDSGGDGLERESDRFEALMGSMLGARSRLQNLSDEERRAAAESLTMQMMARLGLDEDTSDSDD